MTDLLVVSKDLFFGAPSLVLIDVHHNLEVQSWDCRRSLGLDGPFQPSPSTRLQYLWGESCPHLVYFRCLVFVHASCSRISSCFWVQVVFTWENSHEATIKITCWAKLRRIIIGLIINVKSAFKWASRIDLKLHLSQHNSNWRIVQILVLPALWWNCMLSHWHLQQWHRPWSGALAEVLFWTTVEHAKVTSLPARGGDGIHNTVVFWRPDLVTSCLSLASWMHFAVGTKWSSAVLRSLPSRICCSLARVGGYSFFFLFGQISVQRSLHVCFSHSESHQDGPTPTSERYRINSEFPRSSCSCILPESQCNSVQDGWLLSLLSTWTISTSIHCFSMIQYNVFVNFPWSPTCFSDVWRPFPRIDYLRFACCETSSLTCAFICLHLAPVAWSRPSSKTHFTAPVSKCWQSEYHPVTSLANTSLGFGSCLASVSKRRLKHHRFHL